MQNIVDESLSCQYCGKSFKQKLLLKLHEKGHTGETYPIYNCKHCQMTFYQRGSLKSHERIHSAEKPFSCRYCDKTFRQKGVANRHERIHTGEKPFVCQYCQQQFRYRYKMREHEKAHISQPEVKPIANENMTASTIKQEPFLDDSTISTCSEYQSDNAACVSVIAPADVVPYNGMNYYNMEQNKYEIVTVPTENYGFDNTYRNDEIKDEVICYYNL